MSLIESENLPTLFLSHNITDNLFLPTNLSDSLNDILSESKKETPLKPIKFILTKEESPSLNLLQKKTLLKLNDTKKELSNSNGGRWNKDEQKRFAEAVLKYGNDWKKIQNHIFSRNITQVRSHAQKFLMKLKDNDFVKNKGLAQSMSWTKVMNYLRNALTHEELKKVLFSVEQNDEKKNGKKIKKNKKKKLNENDYSDYSGNSNFDTNGENTYVFVEEEENNYKYNMKNTIIRKEEDEEEILKKFIECFNSPSGEITLNTSFEEESSEEGKGFKLINDASNNYSNSYDNILLF